MENQIKSILSNKSVSHICFIIPDARHFMNNLRKLEQRAKKIKKVKLTRRAKEDLKLWLEFLGSANKGISINRIIFRKPNLISYADASEAGISGFCPQTGILWRYKFSDIEAKSFTLNVKEYIASTINTAVQIEQAKDINPYPCILDRTDSTSTAG